MNLLDIVGLEVCFPSNKRCVQVLDDVCLAIKPGESLCVVGESGCGKTILALSIMRLLPPSAKISGEIRFNGKDLLSPSEKEIRKIRGREIAMIFEQPTTCLNPAFTVGEQIAEAVRVYKNCTRRESKARAIDLMEMVGIPYPHERYGQYPHEFSGGMQQRVMIAIAMAFRPSLLIADEPTTSLDITMQVQIMELLKELIDKFKTSLVLITHDLDVAAEMCDKVIVMYAGEIVEKGCTSMLLKKPKHPYSKALLGAISGNAIRPIKGSVPEFNHLPTGCRFHPRCSRARNICRQVRPQLKNKVRCHLCE